MLWKQKYLVIGIDEVGRGAFAGPLVVGAVVFDGTMNRERTNYLLSLGINDSKKLSSEKREQLSKLIKKHALFHAVATINVKTINRVGIGKATQMAVRKVVLRIKTKDDKQNAKYVMLNTKYYLLIDAFYVKYIHGVGLKNQKAIVHGDELSLSIAAASIIAKVYRDNLMSKLSEQYPRYAFHKHKGYGTKDHRAAIMQFGKTVIHREVFVRSLFC